MMFRVHYNNGGWASQYGDRGITPWFELDEVTGLPKVLDKGGYWKIKKSILGPDHMEVHYMVRGGWWTFGSSKEYGFISGIRNREATQEEILWKALSVINQRREAIELEKNPPPPAQKETRPPVSQRKWYGKYPPKTLNKIGEDA